MYVLNVCYHVQPIFSKCSSQVEMKLVCYLFCYVFMSCWHIVSCEYTLMMSSPCKQFCFCCCFCFHMFSQASSLSAGQFAQVESALYWHCSRLLQNGPAAESDTGKKIQYNGHSLSLSCLSQWRNSSYLFVIATSSFCLSFWLVRILASFDDFPVEF